MSPSKRQRPTTGGGKVKGKEQRGPTREQVRRLGLVVFGVVFVGLFVGFAIAEGVGQPSIPSGAVAIIKGMPADAAQPFDKPYKDCHGKMVTQDLSEITEAEFSCAFNQAVAGAGLKKAPKPGEQQYDSLRETTMNNLLESSWIQGLAAEEGISVTEKEVQEELKKLKKQNFKTEAEFQKFLKTSHYTTQDVNERVKIQKLSQELQAKITETPPTPSKSEITDYYEEAKATQFTTPPSRDIRILTAKSKKSAEGAKAALEKDGSQKGWEAAIKKYSGKGAVTTNGGLQPSVPEGQYPEPLNAAMFSAPKSQLEGPIDASKTFYLFEVEALNAEKVKSLKEAESQIKSQLSQQLQGEVFTSFVTGFQSLWTSRTFCASGYTVSKCANYKAASHSTEADPACYEANPKKKPEACPAPVLQLKPALPGTISLLAPKGQQLAQRPQPAGLKAGAPTTGLEGLPPGVSTAPPTSTP